MTTDPYQQQPPEDASHRTDADHFGPSIESGFYAGGDNLPQSGASDAAPGLNLESPDHTGTHGVAGQSGVDHSAFSSDQGGPGHYGQATYPQPQYPQSGGSHIGGQFSQNAFDQNTYSQNPYGQPSYPQTGSYGQGYQSAPSPGQPYGQPGVSYGQQSAQFGPPAGVGLPQNAYAPWERRVGAYLLDGVLALPGTILQLIGMTMVMNSMISGTSISPDGTVTNVSPNAGVMTTGYALMFIGGLIALGIVCWNRWINGGKGASWGKKKMGASAGG